MGQPEDQDDAPDSVRYERGCSEAGSHRSLDIVSRLHQPLPLPAPHLRRKQQGLKEQICKRTCSDCF